jgi:ABC-type sulfate/molybdate transport systems ATPase subunit
MSQGHIEQVGTPDEIYDQPASPFVYSFIGEANTLPVKVECRPRLSGRQPLDLPGAAMADGPANLLFRPHDLEVSTPSPARSRAWSPSCAETGPASASKLNSRAATSAWKLNSR